MKDQLLTIVLSVTVFALVVMTLLLLIGYSAGKIDNYHYRVVYDANYKELVHCRTNNGTGVMEVWNHGEWVVQLHYGTEHIKFHMKVDELARAEVAEMRGEPSEAEVDKWAKRHAESPGDEARLRHFMESSRRP